MNLRELDARVVPELARRTQALAARLRAAHEAGQARVARLRPARVATHVEGGPAPAILRLRELDARLTRSGPLALLREVPQLGGLLLALLILINGAMVAQRSDPREGLVASSPDDPGSAPLIEGGTVGPELGDDVVDYVQKADLELRDRLVADQDERSYATVSFVDYRTPADVAQLLGDVHAFRVFFRVPGKEDTAVEEHPVKRLVPDTLAAYESVAANRRAEAPELLNLAATTDDPVFKADYQLTARQYLREAEQLERGCACVFAVAVTARNSALSTLRKTPGVRVIDLAPSDSQPATILFRGLRPEEKVTVTNGNQRRDESGLVVGG